MALLWYSNETPSRDGQGGQRRQFFLIESLVRDGIEVRAVTLAGPQDGASLAPIATLARVPQQRLNPDSAFAWAQFLWRIARQPWDGVIVSHSDSWRAGSMVARAVRAPVFVDLHNVMSAFYRTRGDLAAAKKYADVERSILQRAQIASVCAPRERDALPPVQHGAKVVVLEHGIDPGEWSLAPHPGAGSAIKLFGNWSWDPNRAGLRWFLEQVWPGLREALPGVRCEIAGEGAEVNPGAGVTVHGRVPSIPEFLMDATVIAVPVMGGVGAPVKYAEALASGVPVAATVDGAHGLSVHGGLVSDRPEDWVTWISTVAVGALERAEARRTRDLVLTDFTWYARSAALREWATSVSGKGSR